MSGGSDAGPPDTGAGIIDVGAGPWSIATAPTVPVPMDDVTVFAFSQVDTAASDPQVVALAPDMNIRAWQRWDRSGRAPGDYDFGYVSDCHAAGVRFIGGTTATAMFRDEWATDAEFEAIATRDASGAIVSHSSALSGLYRASLANPDYRAYLVNIGKIQIDGGVDGLFFDEINSDYQGANYDGNEGFDDYHLADFNAYLLSLYPDVAGFTALTAGTITGDNVLRAGVLPGDLANNFDYGRYLRDNGWGAAPFAAANPLAAVWGRSSGQRAAVAGPVGFTDAAEIYRYWPAIVTELRGYARQQYGRDILVTANGVYPFVDFQGVGLYDYNGEDPSRPMGADYVPVTADGHLDGSQSLQAPFRRLAARSAALAPGAPVVLFIDWPTGPMSRYLALPASEREDYWRIFAAEAYANGLFFAFHLADTVGDPTATDLGLMPLYQGLAAFYRGHADLYHHVTPSNAAATTSIASAMVAVSDQASPHRRLVHVVNHEYAGALVAQQDVAVTVASDAQPSAVTLASPDADADTPLAFTFSGGQLSVTLPALAAYDVIVVAY
jgi:hypothetical protein